MAWLTACTFVKSILIVLVFHLSEYATATDQEDDVQEIYSKEESHSRSRRALKLPETLRWDKGIVPYAFAESILSKPDKIAEVRRAMAFYERLSCIRFVPKTNETTAQYGLDHDGYLKFNNEPGACVAALGNKRNAKGQYIKCCDSYKCMHEIGHALGFIHEHQSPARRGWVRGDDQNVKKETRIWFKEYDEDEIWAEGFDSESVMAYPPDFEKIDGKGDSYQFLFQELNWEGDGHGKNFYYMLKEIAIAYKCSAECVDFPLVCENDGFLTKVEGKCACYCPEGLDPATGCTTLRKQPPKDTKFPGGKWAVPMPEKGCPVAPFEEGYLRIVTEDGDTHDTSSPYHLKGSVTPLTAELNYCVNDGKVGDSQTYWLEGNYCLYTVGGECPETHLTAIDGTGFETGRFDIFFSYPTTSQQFKKTGVLPDGTYDKEKGEALMKFCCREDGFSAVPLYLPTLAPVVLLMPKYTFECQQIFGMHASEEYTGINSLNFYEARDYGKTPLKDITRMIRRFNMKYCYYEPTFTDCGEMITISKSKQSVTIVSPPIGDHRDCHWHIKAPKGDRIKLDLVKMDVNGSMPSKCIDFLDVRAFRMGQPGIKYCGTEPLPSIISHGDTMMVRFATFESSSSSFEATVSLVAADELCYSSTDQGRSYAGTVNFSRAFKPCVPWSDVTHCPHHAFAFEDIGAGLDKNYCRNPGNGFTPWCYTDAEFCKRDYCDACEKGTRLNSADEQFCKGYKSSGLCKKDPKTALQECAKTCLEDQTLSTPGIKSVTCPPPPPIPDGSLIAPVDKSYQDVGDIVTYKCDTSESEVAITCLSNGQWSPIISACKKCGRDWSHLNGKCYKFFDDQKFWPAARQKCRQSGADLAIVKNKATNDLFVKLRRYGYTTFLGARIQRNKKIFRWTDGTPITWDNWKANYPELPAPFAPCLIMESDGTWTDSHCDKIWKRSYICEKKAYAVTVCADTLTTCKDLIESNPDMCTDFSSFSHEACARTCKFCSGSSSDCTILSPTKNVQFLHKSFEKRDVVPEKTEVQYTCKDGMVTKSGDKVRTCQSGTFTGEDLVCAEGCAVPAPTTNAKFVDTSYTSGMIVQDGSQVEYTCKESTIESSGDKIRSCQNKKMTGTDLMCEKGCAVEEPSKNAKIISSHSKGQTVSNGVDVVYGCQDGTEYKSGDNQRTCTDGKFSGSSLMCTETGCIVEDARENTKIISSHRKDETVQNGVEVIYGCEANSKYKSGDTKRTCRDGKLSGSILRCEDTVKSCDPAPVPENGYLFPSVCMSANIPIRTRCIYRCDAGYKRRGRGITKCLPRLTWTLKRIPRCVKKEVKMCERPEIPKNGYLLPEACMSDTVPVRTRCKYHCDDGYKRRGNPFTICLRKQKWYLRRLPRCVKKRN